MELTALQQTTPAHATSAYAGHPPDCQYLHRYARGVERADWLPALCALILCPEGGMNLGIRDSWEQPFTSGQQELCVSTPLKGAHLSQPCPASHTLLSPALLPRSRGALHELTCVHPQLALLWVVVREF